MSGRSETKSQEPGIRTGKTAMADKLLHLHRSLRPADPDDAILARDRAATEPRRRRRIEAGDSEGRGSRNEDEIPRTHLQRRLAVHLQTDPPGKKHALERLACILVAAHPEGSGRLGEL